MSKLNDLLENLSSDAKLNAKYLETPEQVMEEAGLNDKEKNAMRSGDENSLTDVTSDKRAYSKYIRNPD
ncbi:hypothetical protein FM037_09250 [Shewanella psychropiezotolerans]|uniref:Extradiol ring-cleavage dioxygenase LigAB LigA subunit domain-containing protein n=1 Tax=Shewanella psychropiezotolerans TaxID=2593655 RepID=A0ABX5WWC3_9GAMM|nr:MULTISPECIES: hypothetical protein [Shewanella]MPY24997.1 hypothetical protein [Shewanella sp. YLB-07]QDO83379.1 hypothetical protein FM037_09250 [Shewanella psychropiezotolerans]